MIQTGGAAGQGFADRSTVLEAMPTARRHDDDVVVFGVYVDEEVIIGCVRVEANRRLHAVGCQPYEARLHHPLVEGSDLVS